MKSRLTFGAILPLFCVSVAFGATYQNNFHKLFDPKMSDANVKALIRRNDGNYAYAGSLSLPAQSGNTRPQLVKLDAGFQVLWAKSYLASVNAANAYIDAEDVAQTSDGGYILCGRYQEEGVGLSGAFLLKVNGLGGVQWFKVYPNIDQLYSVIETGSPESAWPGYMACGYQIVHAPSGQTAAVILRTDPQGSVFWAQRVSGPLDGPYGRTHYRQIIPYGFGLVALVGRGNIYFNINGDMVDSDALVTLMDTNGMFVFNRLYGRSTETIDGVQYGILESGVSIARDFGDVWGDLVITGGVDTSCISKCGPGTYNDLLLFRIASNGNLWWAAHYDIDHDQDRGTRVLVRPSDSQIFVAGQAQTTYRSGGAYSDDMVLLETNATGLPLSCEVFGGGGAEGANALVPTSSGFNWPDVALMGNTTSYSVSHPVGYLVERFANKLETCRDQNVQVLEFLDDLNWYEALVEPIETDVVARPLQATPFPIDQTVLCPKIRTDIDDLLPFEPVRVTWP